MILCLIKYDKRNSLIDVGHDKLDIAVVR